jgi:tRNA threonylcarbamoyl adenosine modification protein YjeE
MTAPLAGVWRAAAQTAPELERAAARFAAERLRGGDAVLLRGAVGAGKSVFARGVVRALTGDRTLVVPSPTFLLEHEYGPVALHGARCSVRHFDLYRLGERGRALSAVDWDALGWGDVLFRDVCLIEWPECALPVLRTALEERRGRAWDVHVSRVGESDERHAHAVPWL